MTNHNEIEIQSEDFDESLTKLRHLYWQLGLPLLKKLSYLLPYKTRIFDSFAVELAYGFDISREMEIIENFYKEKI